MAPLVRRSILRNFVVVSCFSVCLSAPLALAQHPAGRTAGGMVHTPPPPIFHVPNSAAPTIHAPILHAPIYAPRISAGPSAYGLSTAGFRPPRRPIRPFPPVLIVYQPLFLGGPFWGLNSCWWATCNFFWPGTLDYINVSSPGPTNYISQVYETSGDAYGEEGADVPQLFLKDGTALNVTDYWVVDDQLHFMMMDEDGAKPAEHEIPFEALDLQTTVDANTRRGFRFVLRNEPLEQYVRDHPEGPPPAITRPHE